MELSQRRERLIGRLLTRKSRAKEGRVLVEGVRAVGEALDGGAKLAFALISPRLDSLSGGPELAKRLESDDLLSIVDDELARLSATDTPQGVLAVFEEPEAEVDDVPAGGRVLIIDAVQDPGNLGVLVRSAVAFGLEAVFCLDGTADPWGPKAVRASAGMVFRLPVMSCSAEGAVDTLRDRGIPLLVASTEGRPVGEIERGSGFGLTVGNEGSGVRPDIREVADSTVGIAMRGPAESLNVGIAGSILMHALMREDD